MIVISVITYFYLGLHYGLGFADPVRPTLFDESKTIVDILRSLIETVAIIVAGIWTYERFIKSREEHPYPKIQHQIEFHKADFSIGSLTLLSVFVTITNEGKHKIENTVGSICVEQVSPLPINIIDLVSNADDAAIRLGEDEDIFVDKQRLKLDALGIHKWNQKGLEPGQIKVMRFDFFVEEYVDVISIITHCRYEKTEAEIDFVTLHSIKNENTSVNS